MRIWSVYLACLIQPDAWWIIMDLVGHCVLCEPPMESGLTAAAVRSGHAEALVGGYDSAFSS